MTSADTSRCIQPKRKARSLKFRILEEEGLYYLLLQKQSHSNPAADLHHCFLPMHVVGFLIPILIFSYLLISVFDTFPLKQNEHLNDALIFFITELFHLYCRNIFCKIQIFTIFFFFALSAGFQHINNQY